MPSLGDRVRAAVGGKGILPGQQYDPQTGNISWKNVGLGLLARVLGVGAGMYGGPLAAAAVNKGANLLMNKYSPFDANGAPVGGDAAQTFGLGAGDPGVSVAPLPGSNLGFGGGPTPGFGDGRSGGGGHQAPINFGLPNTLGVGGNMFGYPPDNGFGAFNPNVNFLSGGPVRGSTGSRMIGGTPIYSSPEARLAAIEATQDALRQSQAGSTNTRQSGGDIWGHKYVF